MDGFRGWLEGLSRREVALVSLLAVAAVAGAGLWLASERPSAAVRHEGEAGPSIGPSPRPTPGVIVHVAGEVRRPGVYELPGGARVIEAIELAGGASRRAFLDGLNLAAVLTDGQQVVVPRRPPGGSGASLAAPGSDPTSAIVNINTADAAALDTLPGIGEVLAGRIVEHREANGPFGSVDDLINVSGIGEVTLEELRPLVTV